MNPDIDIQDLNEVINQICNLHIKIAEYNQLIKKENHINENKPKDRNIIKKNKIQIH